MAPEQAVPQAHQQTMQMPINVVSRVDVNRLLRELEALEDYLAQASIRKTANGTDLPRTSRLLEELASTNKLNFLQPDHRKAASDFLQSVADSAPVIHMSFASNPSAAFTRKIVTWLRNNIHSFTLLNVGLEPGIAAGCIVRTPNKQFDFSLRQRFDDKQQMLSQMITGKGT